MAQKSDGDGLQFFPPHVWGLDYHFNTYNKMYIRDILTMQPYPAYPEAFCYHNHPIYKVDIMGTIVKKSENSKCFLYAVDDGTGVILSCCWKENFYRPAVNKQGSTYLADCLREKLDELEAELEKGREGYLLGDLVNMKGKIKIFREKKEVVVNQHCKVDNPMLQVMRILELPRVYSLYYDKPFKPPKKVLQALINQSQVGSNHVKPERLLISYELSLTNVTLTLELGKVDNPMLQVMRILELPRVYSLYYDKPFKPPKKVLQALINQSHVGRNDVKPERLVISYELNLTNITLTLEIELDKVDNPMLQVMRILELPRVYSLYYDKSFKPPKKVMQALINQNQVGSNDVKPEVALARELKTIINNCLTNKSSSKCEFVPSDVLQFAAVKEFMSTHQIKSDTEDKQTQLVLHAFVLLEEDGLAIKRGDRRNLYEFLCEGSKLDHCILKILQKETALPQYAEKGCHYMHVTDELQKTLQYSKVKKDTVLNCLQKLEAQSDVIRSTHAHFLPCVL